MPSFSERLAAMHDDPAYKSASTEEKAAADRGLADKVRAESQQQASVGMQQNAGILGRAGNAIGAFGAGAMETSGAGYAPALMAGASRALAPIAPEILGGAQSTQEMQGTMDAMQAQSPGAAQAGRMAGAFVGPISQGLGAFGSGVGRLAGFGANEARIAATGALEASFGGKLLTNLIANATGAGASNFAYEAVKDQAASGLSERLANAAYSTKELAKSPLAWGLVGAGSLLQTKMMRTPAAENATMIDKLERITGKKVPVEVLTDSADQRSFYDSLARTPGVQDQIAAQRKDAISGLGDLLEEARAQTGAAGGGREALRGRAAATVRKIVGIDSDSPVTLTRQGQMNQALPRGAPPTQEAGRILSDAVDAIRADREPGAISELDGLLSRIKATAEKNSGALSTRSLEEFRGQLEGTAKLMPDTRTAAEAGNRTTKEAGMLRDAIHLAAERTAPDYANALKVSQQLHRMEDALGEVPVRRIDDAQAAAFFSSGTNFPSRWQSLVENSNSQDVASLKGWYWYRLTRAIVNKNTSSINPETLDKLTSREGPFNSQIVETVLGPTALPYLKDHAAFTQKLFGKGRFGAEGSSTAGRLAQYGSQFAGGGAVAAALHLTTTLTNPFIAGLTLLGPIAVRSAIRSAMGGIIEEAGQRVVRQGPTAMGSGGVAMNQGLAGVPFGTPPRPQLLSTLPNQGGSQ